MSSTFGRWLPLSLFGSSHGAGVGVTMDGFPPGMQIDEEALSLAMARRRPGADGLVSPRQETDQVTFLSGVYRGHTTGEPLTIWIENRDQHPRDYGDDLDVLRPGHADWTGHLRYNGCADHHGGGHFSGRMTAPLVAAGALCGQYLASLGVTIGARMKSLGDIEDDPTPTPDQLPDLAALRSQRIPALNGAVVKRMEAALQHATAAGDPLGGVVECYGLGIPPGLGAPFFDGVESLLGGLLFAIPGVKGVSFGAGFGVSTMRGSQANDPFILEGGRIRTATNHAGGLQGGITNGMPLVVQVACKPTASIGLPQRTVSLRRMEETTLTLQGRHDPAFVLRALPVVEAMVAIGLLECWKEHQSFHLRDR